MNAQVLRDAARKLVASGSGAILFDETIHQRANDNKPFAEVLTDAGIIPGIKVDLGAKELAHHSAEKVTEGLDGLRDRLRNYSELGARFAKWRAVVTLGDTIPSRGRIDANAHALTRYAALCQKAGYYRSSGDKKVNVGHDTITCNDGSRPLYDRDAAARSGGPTGVRSTSPRWGSDDSIPVIPGSSGQ